MKIARNSGICKDGYIRMASSTEEELVEFYLESPDWCLERDYPTLDYLRANFSDIEDKGVYIDRTFRGELLNDRQVYIFHNCKGTVKVGLNVDKAVIPMLYIANGCRLRFVGVGDVRPQRDSQRTEVPLYVFGRNDVSARDNVYVKFNRYNTDVI